MQPMKLIDSLIGLTLASVCLGCSTKSKVTSVSTEQAFQLSGSLALQNLTANNECEFCDLQGASFASANLSRVNLTNANLSGANLSNANLASANLDKVNLSGANLTTARLFNTTMSNANLSQANL
ncbi:MAG: pentapeptide repeat-containing protein, partial [Microcoleus sp. SIO2G3]|nr:pentapeptide repeat-containing protein [Microcoleus sp. SIO2G3]